MSEALRVAGLSRSYGPSVVLRPLDLELARGERLAVIGASGSGKSTLLRLIAGLDAPTGGEVHLGGRRASSAGRVEVPPDQRDVAMVFQGLALFPHLRALEQVAFAAKRRGRAEELLQRVGLGRRAGARLDELSGGERQRVALARALAQEPSLILMDEPFASLDDLRRQEMRGLLQDLLAGTEATLVLVTHSRDDALALADRLLVLDGGRAAASGTLEDVLARPGHSAAVRALGLGQVIDGRTEDGRVAETPFGRVELAEAVPAGGVRVLVRAGQAWAREGGAEGVATVVRPEVPGRDGAVGFVATVSAGGQVMRVGVAGGIRAGERVRVRIEGACSVLEKPEGGRPGA